MADENPPIRGADASKFAEGAERVNRASKTVETAAGKTAKVAEDAGARINQTLGRLESTVGGSEAQRQARVAETMRSRRESVRTAPERTRAGGANNEELRRLRGLADDAAASEARLSQQMRGTAISADLQTNGLRRNGAMTTQFIQSAAKGQVTMRELGNTVATTIGKFGAWTAAATAVYGVAAALSQLGKGAIDSEGGVNKVSRVVTDIDKPGVRDRAREGFRDLSEKFNVPISEAVDATYGSGKIFGDLTASLEGANAALFAMKVGELDTAVATESLNAIVKGFKLEAKELPGIFDAINSVTNKFGGNVGKLTQGVGKAGGQFASAGGTPEELIALLSTGSQLTGSSATEVATAVGRGVSRLRTPAGAKAARAVGLDPTLDPYALIQQAGQLAKGKSDVEKNNIARALVPAGGQFVRIMLPIIENIGRLNKVLAATSPGARKDSAAKELAKVMKEPREQVAALGIQLQQIGAAAAQSGMLDPFVLLLKTLNKGLDVVTKMFDLFNKVVPNFMQPILATALQVYGVVRLLRRFDVGGQLAGGGRSEKFRQFIGANPVQRQHKQILHGFDVQDEGLASARASNATAAARAARDETHLSRRFRRSVNAKDPVEEQQRHADNLRAGEQRRKDLLADDKDYERDIAKSDERRRTYLAGRKAGLSPQEALRGKPHVSLADAQAASAPRVTFADGKPKVTLADAQRGALAGGAAGAAANAEAQAAGAARSTGRLAGATRGLGSSVGRLSATFPLIGGAAKGLRTTASAGASAALAAGKGMAGAGRGLLAMLGPLDLALIGLFVGIAAIDAMKKHMEAHQKEIEEALKVTSDPDAMEKAAKALDPAAKKGHQGYARTGPRKPRDTQDSRARAMGIDQANAVRRMQEKGEGLAAEDIQTKLEDDLKTAPDNKSKRALIKDAIRKLRRSTEVIYDPTGDVAVAAGEKVDELVGKLGDLGASGKDINEALAKLDAAGRTAFTDRQAAGAEVHGPRTRRKAIGNIGLTGIAAANQYAENGDPVAYLKSLKEGEDAVTGLAEDRLKRSLDVARSPAARARARRTYGRELTSGLGIDAGEKRLKTLDENNVNADMKIAGWKTRRKQLKAVPASSSVNPLTGKAQLGGIPGMTDADKAELDDLNAKIRSMTQRKKNNRAQAAATRDLQRRRKQLLADAKREQSEAAKDEQEALAAARGSLQAGRTQAGTARVAVLLRTAGRALTAAIKRHGRDSVEALNAMQEVDSLNAQAVQEQSDLILARANLAASQDPTEGGAAAKHIAGMREALANNRKSKDFKPADDENAQAEINDALKQEAERQKQDAIDLIGAKYEYLKSLTDNPVDLAKLEQKQAQQVLDKGGFKNQAEKYRALANRNNAKRDKEKAVSDRKIENLDYDHDIGKLTDDAYIRGLERIMRTMKVGSEARRNLRMQIGRLKHQADEEGEFNVNVGDIKLPTIYEIRRAVAGSKNGATVVQNNTVNLSAHGVNDPAALLAQVDNHINRGARSAARAAGVR